MAEEIQIYKISGHYTRVHRNYTFEKVVRATSEENALDKVLSVVTSQRLKRRKVFIDNIETITLDENDNLYIQFLSEMGE